MNEFDLRNFLSNNPLLEKKQDSKKGNKEEQKRMEGAIKDNADHIEKLIKDLKADKKKLAKLKKDEPKDVKEAQGYNDRDDESIGAKDGAEKDKKVSMKARRDMSRGMEKSMGKRADSTDSKMDEDMNELPKSIRDKEQAQIEKDARKKGLTKEGLKDMIKEKITSILNEAEDVDVEEDEDVEIDIKKDVKIDDESEESTTVVKSELPGESTDTSEVLGLLTKAQEEAQDMNDEVLMDQIGNTITYFTRKHVVKSAE